MQANRHRADHAHVLAQGILLGLTGTTQPEAHPPMGVVAHALRHCLCEGVKISWIGAICPQDFFAREPMPIRVRRTPKAELPVGVAEHTPEAPAQNSLAKPPIPSFDQRAEQILAPPFLSLTEAADWLCVSASTLKRLIAKGELTTVRVGARQKIPASCLETYVAKDILLPSQVTDPAQSYEV